MTETRSPQALRLLPGRWFDARLLLGVVLVLGSMVAGARILSAHSLDVAVWSAAHDLVPGERLAAADLSIAHVRLRESAGRYVATRTIPLGYVVTRYVGSRELVPAAALRSSGAHPDVRLVTVPVEPGHLPSDLGPGTLVDVYVSARAGGVTGGAAPPSTLVLEAAAVQLREGGSRTLRGDSTLAVVLLVPADRVAAVVHAVETGVVDLVALPADAASANAPA